MVSEVNLEDKSPSNKARSFMVIDALFSPYFALTFGTFPAPAVWAFRHL